MSVKSPSEKYIRECGTCYAWAGSNDPMEERLLRDCPTCHKSMFLLFNALQSFFPIGERINLPEPYKAPRP